MPDIFNFLVQFQTCTLQAQAQLFGRGRYNVRLLDKQFAGFGTFSYTRSNNRPDLTWISSGEAAAGALARAIGEARTQFIKDNRDQP